jgi:RNA polymerase-binding transcription factor DksA
VARKQAAILWRVNDPSVSSPLGDNFDTTDSEVATHSDHAVTHEIESVAEPTNTFDEPVETTDGPAADVIDLDAIERDLTDVQSALERLNDGSYWTDEITGDSIPDEVLATFPLTRTVAGTPSGT